MPVLYDPYGRPLTPESSPQDIERMFEESRRQVEENTRAMIEGTRKAADEFEKHLSKMSSKMERMMTQFFETSRGKSLEFAQSLAKTVQQSFQRGIPTTLGQISPGLGKVGEDLGSFAGRGLMRLLGVGGVWAPIAGMIGGLVMKELMFQYEGFRMIGARVAPIVTAGHRLDVDFDDIGARYMLAVRDISRSTGATQEQVAALLDQLSKVGVGFAEGSEREVQFALATERIMNLKPQTVAALQIETVTHYGESLKNARRMVLDMRSAQLEFLAVSWQTNSSIARTLSAGQTLIDVLGQITAGGKNSGASLRDMNTIAEALVKTMATGPGGPMFRPGQMGPIGAGIFQGVLPDVTRMGTAEVFRRSQIERLLLSQTAAGRNLLKQLQERALPQFKDPRLLMLQEQQALTRGRRGFAARMALTKFMGLHQFFESYGPEQQIAAFAAVEKTMGILPTQAAAIERLMHELTERAKLRGVSPTDPGAMTRILKDYMREAQRDPHVKKRLEEAGLQKDMLEAADKQGRAMLSTMDRIANTLMDVRLWAHGYWQNWGRTTMSVFSALKGLPGPTPPGPGDLVSAGTMAAGLFSTPVFGAARVANELPNAVSTMAANINQTVGVEPGARPYRPAASVQTTNHVFSTGTLKKMDVARSGIYGVEPTE